MATGSTFVDQVLTEKLREFTFDKDLIVVLPVLGTIASVTFDVGYFAGIDINYFTLFSAAEHFVFAMEALPLAFVYCVMLLVGLMMWDVASLNKWLLELRVGRQNQMNGYVRRWYVNWLLVPGGIIAGAVVPFYYGLWEFVVIFIGMVGMVVIVNLWPMILMSKRSMVAFAGVVILISVFVSGYRQASNYLAGKTNFHNLRLEDGGMMDGRIIRAGDRGVLLYIPASEEIILVRWDQIKGISRKK
jgi:hypothetical protein